MVPVDPSAPIATTIVLAPYAQWSQTSTRRVKNASTQNLTLQAAAGDTIDGFTNVSVSPGQSLDMIGGPVANRISAV